MKAPTASQMRRIDADAVEKYNMAGIVLMENAGRAVADAIVDYLREPVGKRVCVFCGKGNNGGDGYVAARWLQYHGAEVKMFLFAGRDEIRGDAAQHLSTLDRLGIEFFEAPADPRDWDIIRIAANFSDVLVDALLGTGFQGEIQGPMAMAIEIINSSEKPVFAVDIPSGIDADTGQVRGSAVKALHTVTFALPKPGLLLHPGAEYAGTLRIAPIGLPVALIEETSIQQHFVEAADIRAILPVRTPAAHKGMSGHVLIMAGSRGKSGAAALASCGALRGGAGLVTTAIPESISLIMEVKTTEAMTLSLPETAAAGLGDDAALQVLEFAENVSVIAIGPGLGRHEETVGTIREIIRQAQKPLVIDADALFALAGHMELLAETGAMAILTPHSGEMARLTGLSTAQIEADRIGTARRFAAQWGAVLVLKGAGTVTAFPDGELFVNSTGNPGMATGGSGDVLTGLIAAFIAQGLSSHDAAVAGVYVHGLAGDIAAMKGMVGISAGDLADCIPQAIQQLKGMESLR